MRVLHRIIRGAGWVLLGITLIATLGCFFPSIPMAGDLGPVLIALLGPWLPISGLIAGILALWRWRSRPGRSSLVVVVASGLIVTGTLIVAAAQIRKMSDLGFTMDLASWVSLGAKDNTQPVTVTYLRQAGERLALDIYRPGPDARGAGAPILIYVHGGGWIANSRDLRQWDLRWFAKQGFLVVSVDYSLSSPKRHMWSASTSQVACAVAWVSRQALHYGGDPSRITLMGDSAGGNLSINAAYDMSSGQFDKRCGGGQPRVAAVIALYPVIDAFATYDNRRLAFGSYSRMMARDYIGGTPTQYPARYAYVTSTSHIVSNAPPTLLIVPEIDHLIDPARTIDFAAKARAYGVDARLISVPYASHAFDVVDGSIGSQLVRQATIRFVRSHAKLTYAQLGAEARSPLKSSDEPSGPARQIAK